MAVVNVLDCASLAENAISGVDIYPVPASDILNINFNDLSFETLSLRDATGRVIYNHLKAYGLISIDVSKLASGMYYLVASNHGEYQVQRIIVEQE